uniref:Predicted protein n=1 Tax=Hordeum vulgare subsp. vulgare TaxID=112509 RepID=F2DAK0_HORVV|nr:predicted protein [Hordeum vulgare subsp. vulgare]
MRFSQLLLAVHHGSLDALDVVQPGRLGILVISIRVVWFMGNSVFKNGNQNCFYKENTRTQITQNFGSDNSGTQNAQKYLEHTSTFDMNNSDSMGIFDNMGILVSMGNKLV